MPRSIAPIEMSSFVAGLVTETSPLIFPPNASLDEDNFVLLRDGSRRRRLGLDYEENHQVATYSNSVEDNPSVSSFKWENAGGNAGKNIAVVQVGTQVKFFDLGASSVSGSLIDTKTISGAVGTLSYDSVDGLLAVASGQAQIELFEFSDNVITQSSYRLKVRDFWGVNDYSGDGTNNRSDSGIGNRPTDITWNHLYNLRNQSWTVKRKVFTDEYLGDPISEFRKITNFVSMPANTDSCNDFFYPDTSDEDDRETRRFDANACVNDKAKIEDSRGYFIIDLLARGDSRIDEVRSLQTREGFSHPYLVGGVPKDLTEGGATCLAQFAGRVFYAGFSSENINGDEFSPKLGSYVAYSQQVLSPNNLGNCYQALDPTDVDEVDLLATDGGYLRIDGAYGINRLINVGHSLLVFASNGVWSVKGNDNSGFTATGQLITKISENGTDYPDSIVKVDNTVMYWSKDGIYWVQANQLGDLSSKSLSLASIQSFYELIPEAAKEKAVGAFDSFDKKVRWLYETNLDGTLEDTRELVFDVTLNAFYKNTLRSTSDQVPKPIMYLEVPPFRIQDSSEDVTVEGELVTVLGETVTSNVSVPITGTRENLYITLTNSTGPVGLTFSKFTDTSFRDWFTYDGVGVDSPAFLVTGALTGGDNMRDKQLPYLFVHCVRTEDGFEEVDGDLIPTGQSSCKVQAYWDWANSGASNKWGKEFQAYRYNRFFTPTDSGDAYDTGYEIITTKTKLRGMGKAVSLKFSSEEGKDLRLLGWSMPINVNGAA